MIDATSNLKSISSVSLFRTEVWHMVMNRDGYFARFASKVNSRTFLSTSFKKGRSSILGKIRFPSSKFLRLEESEDLSFMTRAFNTSISFSITGRRWDDTFPRPFFAVSFLSLIIRWRAATQYLNKESSDSKARREFLSSEVEVDFFSWIWLWIVQYTSSWITLTTACTTSGENCCPSDCPTKNRSIINLS